VALSTNSAENKRHMSIKMMRAQMAAVTSGLPRYIYSRNSTFMFTFT